MFLSETKKSIIEILSDIWPLSTKEIFFKLKKLKGIDITYQAVNKALNELKNENILIKEKSKYLINVNWIQNQKLFFQSVLERYSEEDGPFILPTTNQSMTYLLNMPMKVASLVLWFLESSSSQKKQKIGFQTNFAYPTFSLSEKDYKLMQKIISKNKLMMVIGNNSKVDLAIAEEYKKLGANVKINLSVPLNPDVFVCGDYVLFVYMKNNFKINWKKCCGLIGPKEVFPFMKLYKILYSQKTKFTIIITKNKLLAENMLDSILSNYNSV